MSIQPRATRPTSGRVARLPSLGLLHPPVPAARAHGGPDLLDILEALRLGALLAGVVPAERVLAIRRPDRILLLLVHHHLVDRRVFPLVAHPRLLSPGQDSGLQEPAAT